MTCGIKILFIYNFYLSPKEKTALDVRNNSCRDGKERDRIKAVLLRSESWTVPMIAQTLRIHESTVTRHINDYQDDKLTISSGGSDSKLNEADNNELKSHLETNTYRTTQEITGYVAANYGVTYSVPGMNKWLHRQGFNYKKPKGYPHKACLEEQAQFIKYYSDLKANLPIEDGIMFMDSCHPSMATKLSYGWIKVSLKL